jgi:hypothetical protein
MTPKLIPSRQWICDSCCEVIQKPEHGYLEWKRDPEQGSGPRHRAGFRIVHHALHSPHRTEKHQRGDGTNCYYKKSDRGGDFELTHFLGPDGLVALTAWIDVGEEKDPEYSGPAVDLREWTVLFRRLHVPYYEEARQYFDRASRDHFGESNEVTFYLPETLKAMIEEYREEDAE